MESWYNCLPMSYWKSTFPGNVFLNYHMLCHNVLINVAISLQANSPQALKKFYEKNKGVWTHGDWILIDDKRGILMQGRSDATLNRNGIRIGTSEIYSALDSILEIKDSMIVDLNFGSISKLILFVETESELNAEFKNTIIKKIKKSRLFS